MTGHTATPWEVLDSGRWPGIDSTNGETIVVYGEPGEECGIKGKTPEQSIANAKFIVTACNAHDDLVALTKKDLSTMEIAKERLSDMGKSTLELDFAINESRAALASVER